MASDPDITRCEILEVTDQETGQTECHGLVTFRNPKLGEKAIKKLNGKVFMGTAVANVREYTHRSPGDRRFTRDNLGLRRPEERRRRNLIVELRSKRRKRQMVDVEAKADWVRQYGN